MLAILMNGVSIVIGSIIGYFFRKKSSEKISKSIIVVIGLQTFVMGIKDSLTYRNGMLLFVYLIVGLIIGEIVGVDDILKKIGCKLQDKFSKKDSNVSLGFIISILMFCVGSMAILGPLRISFNGDTSLMYVKVLMDGITSIILASTYGIGVLFSSVIVVLYQLLIYLIGDFLKIIVTSDIISDISSVGGVVLLALGISIIFGEKYIKPANLLPGIFLPMLLGILLKVL